MAKKENNAEGSNGGKKNLIIIILAVIIAALAAGGGVYFITQKNAPAAVKEVTNVAYFDLGEYLINLSGDTKGNKYLKATVNVSYDGDNKDLTDELTKQKPAIRGVGLEFLQSKSAEDFTPATKSNTEHNINVTKKALIAELNKKISKGRIIDVYFQDLIVQ